MSGPIVRTGTTPEYWKNWDRVFGKGKGKAGATETVESGDAESKAAKKAAKKSSGEAAAKKPGGRKAAGKAAPGKTS